MALEIVECLQQKCECEIRKGYYMEDPIVALTNEHFSWKHSAISSINHQFESLKGLTLHHMQQLHVKVLLTQARLARHPWQRNT